MQILLQYLYQHSIYTNIASADITSIFISAFHIHKYCKCRCYFNSYISIPYTQILQVQILLQYLYQHSIYINIASADITSIFISAFHIHKYCKCRCYFNIYISIPYTQILQVQMLLQYLYQHSIYTNIASADVTSIFISAFNIHKYCKCRYQNTTCSIQNLMGETKGKNINNY